MRRRSNSADSELQRLQRQFERTNAEEDENAWAQARIRTGVSDLEREIGDAVIRRGDLLNGWQPHWAHPVFLALMPPHPWTSLFTIHATPYWDGEDGAPVSAAGMAGWTAELSFIPLPRELPVSVLARIWRKSMAAIVANLAALFLARSLAECTCGNPEWPLCPSHADLTQLIEHAGSE